MCVYPQSSILPLRFEMKPVVMSLLKFLAHWVPLVDKLRINAQILLVHSLESFLIQLCYVLHSSTRCFSVAFFRLPRTVSIDHKC